MRIHTAVYPENVCLEECSIQLANVNDLFCMQFKAQSSFLNRFMEISIIALLVNNVLIPLINNDFTEGTLEPPVALTVNTLFSSPLVPYISFLFIFPSDLLYSLSAMFISTVLSPLSGLVLLTCR